jgi:hypothetical protein
VVGDACFCRIPCPQVIQAGPLKFAVLEVLSLHLHQLLHGHHVVIEIRHDDH